MATPSRGNEYATRLFNGEAGPPPDAGLPPKKRRGRPPGSRNKNQSPPDDSAVPQTKGNQVGEMADLATCIALADRTSQLMSQLNFRAFGNRSRILVVVVQDNSPSEQPHEEEWVQGSLTIAEELAKTPAARSIVDVAHGTGSESFELLSIVHGANFKFPAGKLGYGTGTCAVPWLNGIRKVVTGYREHLAGLGIGTREVVVVVASDFQFGDLFWDALTAFKAWAEAERVTVVPAVFGMANRGCAADFATAGVPVVDLNKLKLGAFFKALSQSVVRVSAATPERGLMIKAINEAVTPKTD